MSRGKPRSGRVPSQGPRCDPEAGRRGLPTVTPTDREVIARVLSGDVDAFGIIVDRYSGRFARFAARMLGSREDGEEALQDSFLRAYRALGTYRDREQFASWFYRILVNRCRSRLAQRRRRDAVEERLGDHDAPSAEDGGGPLAGDHADAILGALPVEQREVFLLRYVEDLGYDDISVITGVGVSALKMRVKRGLEQLRRALAGGNR